MAGRRILWTVVLAALLTGCGGHAAVAGVARPVPAGPPANACALLTAADVERVLGSPVTATPGVVDVNHPDDRTCRWRGDGGTVSVYFNGSARDSASLRAQLSRPDVDRVAVGDGAIDSVLGLEVLVGDVGLIVNGPRGARAELARAVVGRLG